MQPDGYSYIIYKLEKVSSITYYKPFITPLILKSEHESMYYIARCRPTYIGYLMKQKIKMTPNKPNDFLISLSSVKLKSIVPTILDNILIHLHSKDEKASLPQLKKQYQCNHLNIDSLFKKNTGITFSQYQNILLNIT
ncbi:hypothetical protein [Formosa sp. PL04]|uniref:hypothetical protein n=1 Tax=Formosa sp. PL04 TaxID=3081755 RepID=UPI002981CBA3|nr:hypothetical protein [Formosa sp. PL04]MDW5288786.1 hypothetical protein [Formosa sp. PL04]